MRHIGIITQKMTMDFASHLLALEKYHAKHGELPSLGCWDLILNCNHDDLPLIIEQLIRSSSISMSHGFATLTSPPSSNRKKENSKSNCEAIPLYASSIPAGKPISFHETTTETLNLHDYLIGTPDRTIFLPISGDSMIEAGINHGDLGIIVLGMDAEPGDIVAAEIDGELTLKRLALSEKGVFLLHPENVKYSDMRPSESLRIQGKLVGLVRKY